MEVTSFFTCVECGAQGEQAQRGRKRLRCDRCRNLVPDRRTYADRKAGRATGTCEACGKEYTRHRRTQRWCSQSCAGPNRTGAGPRGGLSPEARERQRLYWQQKCRRRRAAKRGGASELYTLAEIAERDRFMCQLCGKRVAMKQGVPHPNAPTIDHVVPVSEGGDDTRANVQLAHFRCNSVKGPRGSQQLALIG